jgi:hypothetical protein
LEKIAKMSAYEVGFGWLLDPPWQKAFKHTVDVIADYTSYVLVRKYISHSPRDIYAMACSTQLRRVFAGRHLHVLAI